MGFRKDVYRTSGLEKAFRDGLKALGNQDRKRITIANTNSLRGSVDIDGALQARFPNANRWDYVVASGSGNSQREQLTWIEVHPASSGANLQEVKAKYDWLRGWMSGDGKPLADYPKHHVWIATGRSAFHSGMPEIRKLANIGLLFVGRKYAIQS